MGFITFAGVLAVIAVPALAASLWLAVGKDRAVKTRVVGWALGCLGAAPMVFVIYLLFWLFFVSE